MRKQQTGLYNQKALTYQQVDLSSYWLAFKTMAHLISLSILLTAHSDIHKTFLTTFKTYFFLFFFSLIHKWYAHVFFNYFQFSVFEFNKVIESEREATFDYMFTPSETFSSRQFGLTINLRYRDMVIIFGFFFGSFLF